MGRGACISPLDIFICEAYDEITFIYVINENARLSKNVADVVFPRAKMLQVGKTS